MKYKSILCYLKGTIMKYKSTLFLPGCFKAQVKSDGEVAAGEKPSSMKAEEN